MDGLAALAETDLLIGFALIIAISSALAWVANRLAKGYAQRTKAILCCTVMATASLWWVGLRHQPLSAHILPFSNLIILGNWTPLFCAVLAGIAFGSSKGPVLRRLLAPLCLMLVGFYTLIHPLLGNKPTIGPPMTTAGVVRQTSAHSCSPACAATVLIQHDIPATEAELVKLCLCREGTTWQGLYRGLVLKTRETDYKVEVFRKPFHDLDAMTPGWIIVTVGLPKTGDFDPIYEEDYGWRRGELHSVILRDFISDDRVLMVDPDVGEEQWSVDDLKLLYRGFGMRLVPQD